MSNQCSDLFARVFDSHGGGCLRECACGRTHFDGGDNGWTWDDGELEQLREKAAKEPDRYIEQDGTVFCMNIGGAEIVYGCTCDNAERYERFIRAHARQLAEYLRERAKELREAADEMDMPNPAGQPPAARKER
jgi:hypothetical protein